MILWKKLYFYKSSKQYVQMALGSSKSKIQFARYQVMVTTDLQFVFCVSNSWLC